MKHFVLKTICGESTATLEAKEGLAILKAKAESCEERTHRYLGLSRSLAPQTATVFETPNPELSTLNPKLSTLNPKLSILNPNGKPWLPDKSKTKPKNQRVSG